MQYPIIHLFSGDKNIYAQKKGPEYASISLLQTFKNSIILDANGKKFLVKNAHKTGWAYFFGYHPLMKGRTARITYEFSEQKELSLLDYKQLIINSLLKGVDRGFWYSEQDIPLLIEKVNNCANYRPVVECFIHDLYE